MTLRGLAWVVGGVLALPVGLAQAQQWIAPTPEELKMTSVPEAPEAKAVVLYRDEVDGRRQPYVVELLSHQGVDGSREGTGRCAHCVQ